MTQGSYAWTRDSSHRFTKVVTPKRVFCCASLLLLAAWFGLEQRGLGGFGTPPRVLLTKRSSGAELGAKPHANCPKYCNQETTLRPSTPANYTAAEGSISEDESPTRLAEIAAALQRSSSSFVEPTAKLLSFPHKVWNATAAGTSTLYPKVYILPMPEIFMCMDPRPHSTEFEYVYSTEIRIPNALAERNYTTEDPAEADFFYVPAHHYCKSVKLRYWGEELPELGRGPGEVNHRNFAVGVLQYILKEFPFYEPKRAIWMFPHDHGFCGWWTNEGTIPEIEESIILSFWGLTKPEIYCDRWKRIHNYGACPLREHPEQNEYAIAAPCFVSGKDVVVPPPLMDTLEYMNAAEAGLPGLDLREVKTWQGETPENLLMYWPPKQESLNFTFTFPLLIAKDMLAFTPANESQKAVAGVLFSRLLDASKGDGFTEAYKSTLAEVSQEWEAKLGANLTHTLQALPGSTQILRTKNYVLYFKGDIRPEDMTYSHGVRQTAHVLFRDVPGFNIEDRSNPLSLPDLLKEMGKSTFCLAATGAGFQQRLKYSAMVGCIPIIISDDVEMEYEGVLPYKDFAIRLPQHMLYLLPVILDNFLKEPGQVEAMQQRLACAWRYLSWHKIHGRAIEALMCSLQRRLYGPENVRPILDWQTCELRCNPLPLHRHG